MVDAEQEEMQMFYALEASMHRGWASVERGEADEECEGEANG